MPGVVVGNMEIPLNVTLHAIFDSGTSLTYIPTVEYLVAITEVKKNKFCYND
jgi:hypothetical protein